MLEGSTDGWFAETVADPRVEVRAAYAVMPAIVAPAASPEAVLVPRPDGGAPLRLTVGNFIPRKGFTFTEDGEAIPSDDPADLSDYWFGSGDGAEMSLTVREGAMHASVNGSGFSFGIEPTMVGQRHAFQDFDLAELRRKSCPAAPDVRGTAKPDVTIAARPSLAGAVALSPGVAADARVVAPKRTVIVRLLVAYTRNAIPGSQTAWSEARAALTTPTNPNPTDEQILGFIAGRADTGFADLQQALINSGQTNFLTLERAPLVELTYDEALAGYANDAELRFRAQLKRLRLSETLREARLLAQADIVLVLVGDDGNPERPIDGAAYIQRPTCDDLDVPPPPQSSQCGMGSAFGDFALAVVNVRNTNVNYTFAHEVGHTFGAHHAPQQVPLTVSESARHSYGHWIIGFMPPSTYFEIGRDLMAYDVCLTATICSPIKLQFGNPDVPFIDRTEPSGTFGPILESDEGRARNVSLTIRTLAPAMASYRGESGPERWFVDDFE